jgi:hypothetical protein
MHKNTLFFSYPAMSLITTTFDSSRNRVSSTAIRLHSSTVYERTPVAPSETGSAITNVESTTETTATSWEGQSMSGKAPADKRDSQILTQIEDDSPFHQCRHLTFDFTLLDENRIPRNPTADEFETIIKILPPHTGIGVHVPFLVVFCAELPRKPWPLSVAGLPLFLTTDFFGPWFFGRSARIRYRALENFDARSNTNLMLYNTVIDFFQKEQIPITGIAWITGCWSVTVAESVDTSVLPGYICQAAAFYISSKDTENVRVIEAAFRNKSPRDDSYYSPLRPGIIVASNTLLTTSGVLVKNQDGDRSMTVSSHGFPVDDTKVYHPDTKGLEIGNVIHRISDTDIALVKLHDDTTFENQTFQSDDEPEGVLIKNIKDPFDMRTFDALTMDNAFTGLVDGQFLSVSMQRLPTDQQAQHSWVQQMWAWFGQDSNNLPIAGSCGSPVTDSEGNLVCFFRDLRDDNIGIGVSAQELKKRGYSIVT